MLMESLTYPKSGEEWLKTVLIGGVLTALGSFILIPLLPVQGYFVRVLRGGVAGDDEPPVFDRWGELFVDGIQLLVVQFVYVLLPSLLVFVGLTLGGFGAFSSIGGTSTGTVVELLGWALILLGTLVTVVAVYVVPAAVANFAAEDDIAAAFDFDRIVGAAFTADYFVAVVLAIAVGIVLGGLAGLLSILLVGIFVGFYVQVSVYHLIGRGFAAGLEESAGRATR